MQLLKTRRSPICGACVIFTVLMPLTQNSRQWCEKLPGAITSSSWNAVEILLQNIRHMRAYYITGIEKVLNLHQAVGEVEIGG